ncbi:MAG: DUF6794 domain-containing protein [Saprospiraceae bacterium]
MRILFIFSLLIFQLKAIAQKYEPADTEAAYKAQYEERIKKERLFGRYIPKDLNDAFAQLDILIEEQDRKTFKSMSEEDATHKLYFSFHRWIINNWAFDGGSRFSHYLKGIGLSHPDDMATFVMITYHRKLNQKDLDVKGIAGALKDERMKTYKKYQQKGKVIDSFVVKKKRE